MAGCGRKLGPYDCCTVVEGDCLELMKALPDGCVDAVITDPPYGFDRATWDGKDYKLSLGPRFAEFPRILCKGGWLFLFTGTGDVLSVGNLVPLTFQRELWMYKPSDCTFPWRGWLLTSEAILVFSNDEPLPLAERNPYAHDCYLATRIGHEGVAGHPTVKPLVVVLDIANRTKGTILDPFLGSGTTAVAAKKLGRHFLGFEISPKYCRIARERIALVEAQPSLPLKAPEQLAL